MEGRAGRPPAPDHSAVTALPQASKQFIVPGNGFTDQQPGAVRQAASTQYQNADRQSKRVDKRWIKTIELLEDKEVTRYTLNKWGSQFLDKYISGPKATFEDIGDGRVMRRAFSTQFPEALVTKYRYHFVFYIHEGLERPVIIGVVHERRDVVNRLSERLA